MSIKDNIKKLKSEIPSNVEILAATKTRSIEQIKKAIEAGIKVFGENYVQEAEKKYSEIKTDNKIRIYFIGHLQKNKINRALKIFDVVNIDSVEIAEDIDKRADKKVKVMIEVNIADEPQKAGCKPNELTDLIKKISKLKNIEVIGLMAMPPFFQDIEKTRPYFKKMKNLFDEIKKMHIPNINIEILSMGMSDSYKVAIEEGATEVRLGNILFGQRE